MTILSPLLTSDDPNPVELFNEDSDSAIMLLCEHAGQAIPHQLGDLGVTRDTLNSHRGWDIGAEALARHVAKRLGAPLVLQRYSRLVVDCNRPPDCVSAHPAVSDGIDIPANRSLSPANRAARQAEIFDPLDGAIKAMFDRHPRQAAFSVHSFTPVMDGITRPWNAGFLTRRDPQTAQQLIKHIQAQNPDLSLALNEPYQINSETDWFIPTYGEARNLSHALIEIRNDQLTDSAGIALWGDLLADAITTVLDQHP